MPLSYPTVSLKRNKDAALRRFHPWVFSGAIQRLPEGIIDGDLVKVLNEQGDFLGIGHFQDGSIKVRILSFKDTPIDANFWETKFKNALQLRKLLGLAPSTTAYRLINAEGDKLPGLIIDIYGDCAVVQCHSIGMHRQINSISEALTKVLGEHIIIYDKSKEVLPFQYATLAHNGYLQGSGQKTTILENGYQFLIDWESGQKTGFFLDQRNNRHLLSSYAKGKTVLNTFSYSGGFSVYALGGGASKVISVDASKKAIELADENIRINGFEDKHEGVVADVLKYFQATKDTFDVVVVDPPAYAKSFKKRHNAVQGYKRLNVAAFKKVKKGGLLFTFSCSQVVDTSLFENTIVAAALEAGRSSRIVHRLTQPADHPVHVFHPEGNYLKGLVLYVD